jgi:methylenetetrahydrofolate dehydrogenase (NADP+)/methenyltetrahydrofolate cyclohydrolase
MQCSTSLENADEQDFTAWWTALVSRIAEEKDVDGLHPKTLVAVERGTWREEGRVLPATAKAVLSILDAQQYLKSQKYVVLGKSDILGKPLSFELRNLGFEVEILGRKELSARVEAGVALRDANVVISATGQMHVVTGEMIRDGVVLVDVGEPRPDIQRASVEGKAAFLTPVPGGVGPVTVISLLENAVVLHDDFG